MGHRGAESGDNWLKVTQYCNQDSISNRLTRGQSTSLTSLPLGWWIQEEEIMLIMQLGLKSLDERKELYFLVLIKFVSLTKGTFMTQYGCLRRAGAGQARCLPRHDGYRCGPPAELIHSSLHCVCPKQPLLIVSFQKWKTINAWVSSSMTEE